MNVYTGFDESHAFRSSCHYLCFPKYFTWNIQSNKLLSGNPLLFMALVLLTSSHFEQNIIPINKNDFGATLKVIRTTTRTFYYRILLLPINL